MSGTVILLVRHAVTPANVAGIYSGCIDDSLTATGRRDAEQLAKHLVRTHPCRIVSSPLERAIETATPLSRDLGIEVEVVERLGEMHMGPWTGLSAHQIEAAYPAEWSVWRESPDRLEMDGFEGLRTLKTRASQAVTGLAQHGAGELPIAVFTHETVIKVLLEWALGVEKPVYRRLIIPNCSVSRLVLERDEWKVASINEFSAD